MILPARLIYKGIKLPNFRTCYQHYDAYFDKIWYEK